MGSYIYGKDIFSFLVIFCSTCLAILCSVSNKRDETSSNLLPNLFIILFLRSDPGQRQEDEKRKEFLDTNVY